MTAVTYRPDWRLLERFAFYSLILLFTAVMSWIAMVVLAQFLRPAPPLNILLPSTYFLAMLPALWVGMKFRHTGTFMAALAVAGPLYVAFGLFTMALLQWN